MIEGKVIAAIPSLETKNRACKNFSENFLMRQETHRIMWRLMDRITCMM